MLALTVERVRVHAGLVGPGEALAELDVEDGVAETPHHGQVVERPRKAKAVRTEADVGVRDQVLLIQQVRAVRGGREPELMLVLVGHVQRPCGSRSWGGGQASRGGCASGSNTRRCQAPGIKGSCRFARLKCAFQRNQSCAVASLATLITDPLEQDTRE